MVKEKVDFQRPKGYPAQHPLNGGIGPPLHQFATQEAGQEGGVKADQAGQIRMVFSPDQVPQLGLPAPTGLKMAQGYQIVRKLRG